MEKKDIKEKAIATLNRFSPVYDRISDGKSEQIGIFSGSAGPKEKADGTEIAEKAKPDEVPKVPFDDLPFIFEDIVKEVARQEEEKTEKDSLPPQNQESTVSPGNRRTKEAYRLSAVSLWQKEEGRKGRRGRPAERSCFRSFLAEKSRPTTTRKPRIPGKGRAGRFGKGSLKFLRNCPETPPGKFRPEKEEFRLIGHRF